MMYIAAGRIVIAVVLALNVPAMLGFEPPWWLARCVATADLAAILWLCWTAFGTDDFFDDDDDDLLYGA